MYSRFTHPLVRSLVLPQVYTSLYVSSVARLRDTLPDLHAYCLSVDVMSTFLYDAVYSNRVCCDEDVSVVLCGVVLSKYGPDDAIEVLEDRGAHHLDVNDGSTSYQIAQRLRWRRATLKALVEMARASTQADLDDVVGLCSEAIASLEAIEFLGDAEVECAEGFVPSLYYASWRHAPMRDVTLRPMREAVVTWMSMLRSLKESAFLLARVHSWATLKAFLDHIAARDYHGFVRCLVFHLLKNQGNDVPWRVSELMLAESVLLLDNDSDGGQGDHHRHHDTNGTVHRLNSHYNHREDHYRQLVAARPEIGIFFEQCVLAAKGLCFVKCLNRPRQHRRLRHFVLDWRDVMGHAFITETAQDYRSWITDQGFAPDETEESSGRIAPITSWVTRETCWTCIEQLLVGGPLELYQPQEISMVFWYVSYLIGLAERATKEHASVSRGKRQQGLPDSNLEIRSRLVEVLRMAIDSVSMTCIALQGLGMFPTRTLEFNEDENNFEQRFGFMAALEFPRYQSHDDYSVYERNIVEFAGSCPRKLVLEAFLYAATVHKRLTALSETVSSSVHTETHVAEEVWATLHRTLVANMTALKLLVTLLAEDEEASSQYSASWTFLNDEDVEEALRSPSNEGCLCAVVLALPRLFLKVT